MARLFQTDLYLFLGYLQHSNV